MVLLIAIIIAVVVGGLEDHYNKKKVITKTVECKNHMTIIKESIDLFSRTTNAKTFFGRYRDAIYYAELVLSSASTSEMRYEAKDFLDSLLDGKESLVDDFLLRCFDVGKLYSQKDIILSYKHEMTNNNLNFLKDLLAEKQ